MGHCISLCLWPGRSKVPCFLSNEDSSIREECRAQARHGQELRKQGQRMGLSEMILGPLREYKKTCVSLRKEDPHCKGLERRMVEARLQVRVTSPVLLDASLPVTPNQGFSASGIFPGRMNSLI